MQVCDSKFAIIFSGKVYYRHITLTRAAAVSAPIHLLCRATKKVSFSSPSGVADYIELGGGQGLFIIILGLLAFVGCYCLLRRVLINDNNESVPAIP